MVQEGRLFAFRWLLPSTQLLLCSVALWPLRPLLIQQVRDSIHAYRVRTNPPLSLPEKQQQLVVPLSPREQLDFETFERLQGREWIPQTLNLPCMLVQLPYVILNQSKQEWVPRHLNFRTWRVISWPLLGILFWWIAGRGIEGLIAARRRLIRPKITWIETVVGAALCGFCAVAAVCMPLFTGRDETFPMKLFVAGFVMWSVLGGLVVAGRVAQSRLRKRLASGAEQAFPLPIAKPQRLTPQIVRFVGEQDGPAERDLKAQLVELLRGEPSVQRAYLALTEQGDGSTAHVTLCLRCSTNKEDRSLLTKLAQIFGNMFNSREHPDVRFLREGEERELCSVCTPFYSSERTSWVAD